MTDTEKTILLNQIAIMSVLETLLLQENAQSHYYEINQLKERMNKTAEITLKK